MEARKKLTEIDRELEAFDKSDRELDEVRERVRREAPKALSAVDAALTLIERGSEISSQDERPLAEPGAHQGLSDLLSAELQSELADVLEGSLPLDDSTPENELELTIDEDLVVVEEPVETLRASNKPPPPPTKSLSARPARIPSRSLPRK